MFDGPPITILMYFSFALIMLSSVVAGWHDMSFGVREDVDVSLFVAYFCIIPAILF
jgi:hypothetical protein